jgi:hypothetical protein
VLHFSTHHLQELLPRKVTLTEKKITFDDENGTPSGATSSLQAHGQPHYTYASIKPIESFCEIGLAILPS